MIGLTNAGGGSGGGLNFRVIGGLTQPVASKYNDIWVKTSVKISDWEFSEVNMPSHAMSEGFVYFTSTYNGAWAARESTGLNFLRKHAILTKLTAACQYYSGAWHSMDAYIYKSGTWVQFSWTKVYLYNRGDSCNAITGNWKSAATGTGGWGNGSVGNNDGTLNVSAWDVRVACAATNKKIDLSKFKTLTFVVSSASGMNNGWHRGVLLTSNSFNWNPDAGGVNGPGATSHSVNITGPGTFNIDISGQNEALYVGVAMAYQSAVSISEIYLS